MTASSCSSFINPQHDTPRGYSSAGGWRATTARAALPRPGKALAAVIVAALSAPVLWASQLPDGHWGENLGVHTRVFDAATHDPARRVWFVAPRNRAVLFAEGELSTPWRAQGWWKQARDAGTLWGPAQPAPHLTQTSLLVVTDTRRVGTLSLPATCDQATQASEARSTSILVTCS